MARNAVGFYWTLPVPWAGFNSLPDRVDEAAKVSLTIRYQRDLIRRYARDEGYHLVHEEVFLEVDPDRGSDLIREPLGRVEKICKAENAILFYVDFWDVYRWREHRVMINQLHLRKMDIESRQVAPSNILIDGKSFDPHRHFALWRKRQEEWKTTKPDRGKKAFARAAELQEKGSTYQQIADTLNDEKVLTTTGKRWAAENIRKLLKKSP